MAFTLPLDNTLLNINPDILPISLEDSTVYFRDVDGRYIGHTGAVNE